MRFVKLMCLYAALSFGAIGTAAADTGKLIALAQGDLSKLTFHATPKPVPNVGFVDAKDRATNLEAYRGKHVVLNFWALWCAPCREEMPSLDNLNAQLGGKNFAVVTIATGRNARPAVDEFFMEEGLKTLPKLFDPKMKLAQAFRASGLPVTVLIDPQGREIARVAGAVHWDSPAAVALLNAWRSGS